MLQKVALVKVSMKLLSILALVVFLTTTVFIVAQSSSLPQDNEQISAERRAIAANDATATIPLETNPMNPFLSIKPFFPVKPTFMPPFVNPEYFINQKAALLNSLFGGTGKPTGFAPGPTGGNYFLGQKAALVGSVPNQASTATQVNPTSPDGTQIVQSQDSTLQRRLVVGPPPPIVDPKIYADKKADFLNKLFSSLSTSPVEDDGTVEGDTSFLAPKPTIVPPGFWSPFSAQEPVTPKPTIVPANFWYPFAASAAKTAPVIPVKPTIVPPSFWSPFAALNANKAAAVNPFKSVATPVVDPSVFINKKTVFLNKLFETLQTTPAPPSVDYDSIVASEELDPSSVYEQKLSEFLDKLYNSLVTTPLPPLYASSAQKRESQDIETRAISSNSENNDIQLSSSVLDAKDNVVESILAELVGIKNNMLQEVADLIKKQKETAAAAAESAAIPPFGKAAFGKAAFGKPSPFGKAGPFGKASGATGFGKAGGFGKPFPSPYASLWAPTPKPKPTPDPLLAYEQKFKLLNDLFESLTKVEKDVNKAVNKVALEGSLNANTTPLPPQQPVPPTSQENETDLIELIKNKIRQHLTNSTSNSTTSGTSTVSDFSRRDTSSSVDTSNGEKLSASDIHLLQQVLNAAASNNVPVDTRSIKMAVHQGYQSLPPGSEEIIQAGGGGVDQDHEGGGLRLQAALARYLNAAGDSSQHHQHHHNHH